MATLNNRLLAELVEDMPDSLQEVYAEIGRLVVERAEGRPELAQAIFDAALPAFRNKYPHHKVLTTLRQGLEEAKPLAGIEIPPDLLK